MFTHRNKILLLLVVVILGMVNLSGLGATRNVSPSDNQASTSMHYAISVLQGHIPPRFDEFANNGFGDARFTHEYPVKIWFGIPAGLLKLSDMQARIANLMILIAIFQWGLHQIDKTHITRLLTFSSATTTLLIAATLDLVGSDLLISLMTLPWLVWATSRFVKMNSVGNRWWSRAISKEGLVLVLVLSLGSLASSAVLPIGIGLLLGILIVGEKSITKTLVICLLWALANTAWFWLPHYAEKSGMINDVHSGNFNTKTFNEKKASEIFDDYPNQRRISPNAAVKIIPNHSARRAHSFTAIVPERSLIIEKTMHVAGWSVKANGQPLALEDPADQAGLVAYQLEAGTHLVTSQMTQLTIPRIVGNSWSIVSVAIWVWCMQKAKRPGMTNVQRLFRISLSSKERLAKIMRKFWRRQNQ